MQAPYRKISIWLLMIVGIALCPSVPRHADAQDDAKIIYKHLAWSPDGTKIAYERTASDQHHIWVYDFETGQHQNLSGEDEAQDASPIWSPDGTKLVYESTEGIDQASVGFQKSRLWMMNADGTEQTNLTSNSDYSYDPRSFSPDGKYILVDASLFDLPNKRVEFRVALLNLSDLTTQIISPDDDSGYFNSMFTANGQHIVFQNLPNIPGSYGLWVVDFRDGETTSAKLILDDDDQIGSFTASPDSCCVVYSLVTIPDDEPGIQSRIKTLDLETGAIQTLTEGFDGNQSGPAWSPDGSKIMFLNFESGTLSASRLWVMEADGSNPMLITPSIEGRQGFGVWSPDSTRIAFINIRYENDEYIGADIWVVDADGGNLQNLTGNYP